MMNLLTGQMAGLVLGLLAGVGLGVWVYSWWSSRKGNVKLRLPAKWPMVARGLVSSSEDEVWKWLREVFHDHQVMVKTPVLRFTALSEKEKNYGSDKEKAQAKLANELWLDRLSGIYTTFAVSTVGGKVVGCIDVLGKTPQTKTARELKETLLSDCGIAYTEVATSNLPTALAMRAAFLGELPVAVEEHQATRGGDTRFNAELKAFTIEQVNQTKDLAPKKLNVGF